MHNFLALSSRTCTPYVGGATQSGVLFILHISCRFVYNLPQVLKRMSTSICVGFSCKTSLRCRERHRLERDIEREKEKERERGREREMKRKREREGERERKREKEREREREET